VFTGIIEEIGVLRSVRRKASGGVMLIEAAGIADSLKQGDSVAANGVCVTVAESTARTFTCDLSAETLRCTSLGDAGQGTAVNLERALAAGGRLGGHIVQGHVDCTGRLVSVISCGDGVEMEFAVPAHFEKYLVIKGSVAVDGISLTVAKLKKGAFAAAVIPHTLRATNLGSRKPGAAVNLEADILAKYFERFFQLNLGAGSDPQGKLTVESLKRQGY
jgi:riboflavin synthase